MSTQEQSTPTQLPESGEVLLLAFHQDRFRWRPVVYAGPPDEPNNAAELWLGAWRTSLRKAQVSGLKQYFDIYAERYGFPHPEDPSRRGSGPLPYTVVSMRNLDRNGIICSEAYTFDPDVVH